MHTKSRNNTSVPLFESGHKLQKITPPFGGVIFWLGDGREDELWFVLCTNQEQQLIIVAIASRESGHDLHGTKCLQIVRDIPFERCPCGIAASAYAKNVPPARFLNAAESDHDLHGTKCLQIVGAVFYLSGLRHA